MKDKPVISLKRHPLFLFLLPVFFVLHGCTQNFGFVPAKDALLLVIFYLGASLILLLLSRLLFRNWPKAATFSLLIMGIHFFFGGIQDALRNMAPGTFLSKWVFLVPFLVALLITAFIILQKTKRPLHRTSFYFNTVLLVLIGFDILILGSKFILPAKNSVDLPGTFSVCDTCPKPDIFVIIADEYPGLSELNDIFKFDNSGFQDQLTQRGFHVVPGTRSNYNLTPYSIASTLNMEYLDLDRTGKQPLLAYAYETIGKNNLLKFLERHGYAFHNYSLSDFKGHPSFAQSDFLPVKTKLITSQTFVSRLQKELGYHWIMRSQKSMRDHAYRTKRNNEKLFQLTAEKTPGTKPSFVLTHLMMPHYPYYFDEDGREYPFEQVIEGTQHNQEHFIEYLKYSNKKYLELIDRILQNSKTPPVIVLFGDHGFRHFKQPIDPNYYFSNLMAVYLPNPNFAVFHDSLTNVNLFRTVLNTTFDQRLPMLRDTTIIVDNP